VVFISFLFNSSTTIEYVLTHRALVEIEIFGILGKKICTLICAENSVGAHHVIWNGLDNSGSPVSSGIYFCSMTAEGFCETRKLLVLK
jgi:flagellar hook assembly protein FlgD